MTRQLDFYFDFMSPFSYLAYWRLGTLARQYDLDIKPIVIDLAFVKKAVGNTGPRNVDIPLKIKYLREDLARWARRYEIPLIFPASLELRRMNIGALYAADRGQSASYLQIAWHQCWTTGADMSDIAQLVRIARDLSWNESDLLSFLDSEGAAARYRADSQGAVARGVFGVPTMMIEDRMWWGNDRIDFLVEYLSSESGSPPCDAGEH